MNAYDARMARLTEVFTGRDTRYFDLFEEAARTAVTAAELLQRFVDGIPDQGPLAKEIGAVESEADRITHDLIQHTGATFVTPLEREDILELASAQDDVVDFIDETADLIQLYKVEAPMEEAIQLCDILLQATRALSQAMPRLRSFGDVRHYTVEVNRLENDADRLSRQAIASLFDGGIDPMVVIPGRTSSSASSRRWTRPSGSRTSSRASSSRTADAMSSDLLLGIVVARRSCSTSRTASTTPPTSSPPRSPRALSRRAWRSPSPRCSTSSARSCR